MLIQAKFLPATERPTRGKGAENFNESEKMGGPLKSFAFKYEVS
jgi:hypothetical protein